MDSNRFVLSPLERVHRVLDRECSDVYPHEVRGRLAFCALRHVARAETSHRRVKLALKWLRERGHMEVWPALPGR